jgi:hypothetical protein
MCWVFLFSSVNAMFRVLISVYITDSFERNRIQMNDQTLLFPVSIKKKLAYIDRNGKLVHHTDLKSDIQIANYNGGIDPRIVFNLDKEENTNQLCFFKRPAGAETLKGAQHTIYYFGFKDRAGQEVIECKYINAYPFFNGVALVQVPEPGNELHQWFNSKPNWILINELGEQVSVNRWDWAFQFSEGLAVIELDGKLGYINTNGELVIGAQFDFASRFIEGTARVAFKAPAVANTSSPSRTFVQLTPTRPGKFGLIDTNGNFSNTT